MTKLPEEAILIGTGVLTWMKGERISDRYGSVFLTDEDSMGGKIVAKCDILKNTIDTLLGKNGSLVCEVIETRKSTHIGDMFHSVSPKTPKAGELIVLGIGALFIDDGISIGVIPADGRCELWLDVNNLYRAHEQTVKLYFIPVNDDKNEKKSEMDSFYESQKKIGLNMAVVMYMVGAMMYFKKQPSAFVKHVAFQIATIGVTGISPTGSGYKVSLIGDKEFTGYQLLAYYYVSWAMAMPHLLSGLPYEKEYESATKTFYPMFQDKEEKSMYDYFQKLNMN